MIDALGDRDKGTGVISWDQWNEQNTRTSILDCFFFLSLFFRGCKGGDRSVTDEALGRSFDRRDCICKYKRKANKQRESFL